MLIDINSIQNYESIIQHNGEEIARLTGALNHENVFITFNLYSKEILGIEKEEFIDDIVEFLGYVFDQSVGEAYASNVAPPPEIPTPEITE